MSIKVTSDCSDPFYAMIILYLFPHSAGLAHSSFIRCPVEALKWTYRAPSILQEILRSGADIICMEEVDHFHDFLHPQLEQKGFKGLFVEKKNSPCLEFTPNNGPDGCALFYRSSMLKLLKKKDLVLNREDGTKSNQVAMMVQLQLSPMPGNNLAESSKDSEGASKDDVNSPSKEKSSEKAQLKEPVATSKSAARSTKTVCVAITHLKAKREGSELRLAQGKHLLSEIQAFAEDNPVIVCGDFNASPDEPVCELFQGSDSPPKLSSSYITPHYGNKEPPFTSWKFRTAGESKYTIDYIWFNSDTLKVDSIWTVPTEEEIGKDGLPCAKYPSDHVSLCTCFRLESEPTESV